MLAGGTGSRLRPITHTSAKQLIPVANKPVLFYGLEAIADAGITDVGIIVGSTAAEIEAAVGDGSQLGLRVTYLPQEAPLGLAHAVLIARDFLADEPFVMYLGDNFLIGGITSLVDDFRARQPDAQILLTPVPNPAAFGVAELDADGHVVRLEEKPLTPKSDLALVGVYLFGTAVHDAVRAITPSARGELEITEAIQWLIDQGRAVRSHLVDGYWKDTGRAEDILACNRRVLESLRRDVRGRVDDRSQVTGQVVIAEDAVLERSVVRGPVVIGSGTRLIDTYVGPFTSIAQSCTLVQTEIEHSIVLEQATIRGVRRIEDSLIGKAAEVAPAEELPTAHRLIVGDHSKVFIA